ncbi:MAG: sigma-54-dependent Fis family transcriptional regulator [Acidobacteriota bacterium]
MKQQLSVQLFNFCRSGQLCETLATILKASLENKAEVHCEDVSDFCPEFEDSFFKVHETSNPHLVLLILTTAQLPLARKLIPGIKNGKHDPEIMLVTDECDADEILSLMSLGASDFIIPPLNASATMPRVWRLLQKAKSRIEATQSLKARVGLRLLIGESPVFLAEVEKIRLLASCDGRVLILGQSGTGKELFARAIHYLSARMTHPFVAVSCGAIPVDLLENEMFGHKKGAFTGATTSQPGLISEAEGGTLFLDEIDCLPLLAQSKLLRFLQEGEYKPLGSSKSQPADVRVIAASNIDLEQAVKEGRLRQDLYYRLNIARVNLPALRDRRNDIPLLAEHFLEKYAHQFGRSPQWLSEAVMQKLIFYDWPGNIRELENAIERAVMLTEKKQISDTEVLLPQAAAGSEDGSFQAEKARVVSQFERTYIQNLMVTCRGNVSQAARAAKKNRRAFWELIRKHKLDVQSFRTNSASAKN